MVKRGWPSDVRLVLRAVPRSVPRMRFVHDRCMLMLGAMRAEQRLASFLLDLSRRYHERGYSSTEFVLRMTREEIGSFLGLKLETVSRLFSRFNREGLIHMSGRSIRLADPDALRHLLNMSVQQ